MVMTPEAWTVVGTGVVILIAIAASNRQLRGEVKALHRELHGEMKTLRQELHGEMKTLRQGYQGEIKELRDEFRGEMNHLHTEFGQLRERMAKLEGLLAGLREAITGRKAAA